MHMQPLPHGTLTVPSRSGYGNDPSYKRREAYTMESNVPELDPAIAKSIQRGRELFNKREFFEAHEIWEDDWRDSQMEDRHLLQGLIQVAAGFYKLQKGMPSGTFKLLAKSVSHLAEVPEDFYGLDLTALMKSAATWEAIAKSMVDEWRTDYDADALPRLEYKPGHAPGET